MTARPSITRPRETSGEVDSGQDEPRCAVCSHRLTDHDVIGLRYCQATQAQALPRNCICRGQ
jgi:hypothetical protein